MWIAVGLVIAAAAGVGVLTSSFKERLSSSAIDTSLSRDIKPSTIVNDALNDSRHPQTVTSEDGTEKTPAEPVALSTSSSPSSSASSAASTSPSGSDSVASTPTSSVSASSSAAASSSSSSSASPSRPASAPVLTPYQSPQPQPPPDGSSSRLVDGLVRPSEEAVEETTACGEVLAEKLVIHANGGDEAADAGGACTASDVYRAVHDSGHRSSWDGPLHITTPRRCGGRVHWHTAEEACDLLQRAGFLFLAGDSLSRHIANALFAVVTGDPAGAGNMFSSPDEEGFHSCECKDYFDDGHWATEDGSMGHNRPRNRYCRERAPAFVAGYFSEAWVVPARYPQGVPLSVIRAKYPGFCPRWERWHFCYMCDQPGMSLPASGIVFRQGGLHLGALDESGVTEVFQSMPPGVPEAWPRICSLLHAPGTNKPVEYLHTHGLEPTRNFNSLIAGSPHACKRAGDAMFDAFTVTANASSIDGQHYPLEPNVLMVQLLLNQVRLMTPEAGAGAGGLRARRQQDLEEGRVDRAGHG